VTTASYSGTSAPAVSRSLLALRYLALLSTLNVLFQGGTAGEVLMRNHQALLLHEARRDRTARTHRTRHGRGRAVLAVHPDQPVAGHPRRRCLRCLVCPGRARTGQHPLHPRAARAAAPARLHLAARLV
jgi:hypothetical protein